MTEVPPNFPVLQSPQVAVLMAEAATGIVLLPSGERMLGTHPEGGFQVFDSLKDARDFCELRVATDPWVEFGLFDSQGTYIDAVRGTMGKPAHPERRSVWATLKGLLGRRGG